MEILKNTSKYWQNKKLQLKEACKKLMQKWKN